MSNEILNQIQTAIKDVREDMKLIGHLQTTINNLQATYNSTHLNYFNLDEVLEQRCKYTDKAIHILTELNSRYQKGESR